MMHPDLPPSLKARILASTAAEPAKPSRAARIVWLAALSPAWLALPLFILGVRPDFHELPAHYSIGTLIYLTITAAILSTVALSRGRRMLGVRLEWMLGAVVLLPIGLCVWTSLVVGQGPSSYPCPTAARALELSPPCLVASMTVGVPLSCLLLWFRRGVLGSAPALTGAAIGAAAATWAHVVLHTHCPIAHPVHALAGHLLPILPTAALAAYLATKLR